MAKSRLSRARIGGWVVAGGILLLVLGVLGYHVITASGQSSVFAAGQCVLAAAALASAAVLAYGYRRGLIQRGTKQEEVVVRAVVLGGFFRVLIAAAVAARVGALCFGVPGESLPVAIDVSVFWAVVAAGMVWWLICSVTRASDKGFFRILGAALIAAVIGEELLRAIGWPELMREVICIDNRAVGTAAFWAVFAVGIAWGVTRGAQGLRAALQRDIDTSPRDPVTDRNTAQK